MAAHPEIPDASPNPSPVEQSDILRSLADRSPFGAVLTHGNEVLYFNHQATCILGYELADLPTMATAFETFYPEPQYRRDIV